MSAAAAPAIAPTGNPYQFRTRFCVGTMKDYQSTLTEITSIVSKVEEQRTKASQLKTPFDAHAIDELVSFYDTAQKTKQKALELIKSIGEAISNCEKFIASSKTHKPVEAVVGCIDGVETLPELALRDVTELPARKAEIGKLHSKIAELEAIVGASCYKYLQEQQGMLKDWGSVYSWRRFFSNSQSILDYRSARAKQLQSTQTEPKSGSGPSAPPAASASDAKTG